MVRTKQSARKAKAGGIFSAFGNLDRRSEGEEVGPSYEDTYDTLQEDVLGEDDSGSDDDYDYKKKEKKKLYGEEEDNEDKKTPYMFFDFRHGKEKFPENVVMVDSKRAADMLEKATAEAEENAKANKKNDEGDDFKADGPVGPSSGSSSGGTSMWDAYDSKKSGANKEEEEDNGLSDATFEVLRDGSTALLLKPGYRLKLNLKDLLDGGDDEKEAREKKAAKEKKRRAKYSSSYSMWGGNDVWGDFKGGKWFKEYINAYTVTIDMKLLEEPPRDGLALFQTALIHTEDDKRSGKTAFTRSDGECIINQAGGVGMFGTYGDTTRARIDINSWKRVVVSVKCGASASDKGEMRTWVGTESGVVLKEESITDNGRFALDPNGGLFMFSSSQGNMMPGQVAIRAIRVESAFSTDEDVKANRAKDKILSRYEEDRKAEVEEQRKGLSLACLFPKPRPMWITPSVWGLFGDSFLERTTLEGSSSLAWSYTVLNHALQRMMKQKLITGDVESSDADGHLESKDNKDEGVGFDRAGRVGLADTLHVMQQSAVVFKNMLRMLKTPSESQLLSFLKKLKKILGNISKGESLLLPLLIENSELLLLLERTTDRVFKVVVIQTDPFGGLKNHSVSANNPNSEIKYRTCLVLNDIVKKNVLDDVFWTSVYNLAIHSHKGDINRFYDVLIPFLTGKPLEESLVEAENEALENNSSKDCEEILDLYGDFRSPQRSNTAYVRCVIEAMHYMLRRRKLTTLQVNTVHLALCIEVMEMIKNDLVYILPEENGQRVCALAVRELSHFAVKLADQEKNELDITSGSSQMKFILKKVHELTEDVTASLKFCQDETVVVPPKLELEGAKTSEENDPALTQFSHMLAWDVAHTDPDPGQAVSLRKYVPIDFLQIPQKITTRDEAITAIRVTDRVCTLIENQSHCIKNDKFLIASLIEHVFVQVLPVPKPRGVKMTEKEEHISTRTSRREEKKAAEALLKAENKKKKMKILREVHGEIEKDRKTIAREKKEAEKRAADQEEVDEEERRARVDCFGEQLAPDFSVGNEVETEILNLNCVWDGPITYELQVELLITLQRLCEHFVSSVMSIQQSRPFDAVCITVPGCICAISDALMRKIATDEPSEVCSHLMGRSADGRQLGYAGFGISVGSFATQSETIEVHYAELSVARTAVLDYFQSPQQKRLDKIFTWEEEYVLKPGQNLIKYLRMISREIALPISKPYAQLCDGLPDSSHLMKNYPELHCFRDVVFWWKYLLNPDRKIFPNYSNPEEPKDVGRMDRMSSQLLFRFDESLGGYVVTAMGVELKCRPDPNQTDPVTGKKVDPSDLPSHRFPSTATPSFYVSAPPIRSEDDVIYRPNLPSFDNSYGQVLNQRDSELLISYLTVPYMRLPLLITFFSTEDRIHKLQSPELRNILDSVLFEPGKYLQIDMGGVQPLMVPTIHKELLATPYGLLMNELYRSPETSIKAVLSLLKGALAVDTGSVVDEGAERFNTSTVIILYITRLACRVDNYLSFLIDWTKGKHSSVETPLRDVEVYDDTLQCLDNGLKEMRSLLHNQFAALFEDYLLRLDSQVSKDPNNEFLIDRNSRLACDLHSHKLLLYRNFHEDEITTAAAKTLMGSFVYLTTRHTWNKAIKRVEDKNGTGSIEEGRLHMPETELYELLQNQRRRLIAWASSRTQGLLDEVMQTALQVSSSLTGSFKTSAAVLDKQNRWSRIQGRRSCGRWAVGSTRTAATDNVDVSEGDDDDDLPPIMEMTRQQSYYAEVGEVADTGMLGVEIDCQLGQMTLRSKHLAALASDIANHPDVIGVFGDSTIQASLVERAEHRQIYRLVGLHHELEYWPTAHTVCPPLGDEWEREYDPAELFDSELWIVNLFEPIRKNFFDGPSPPPMQFMMPEKALPEDAEVAVILGLHQKIGGPWKLVYVFRRLRCLHVYECVSQGREWWFSLHLTTDTRYCLRDMQPSTQNRQSQYPDWWINASGAPYPMGCDTYLVNDIDGESRQPATSVLVVRDQQHPKNLSGGKEVLVPSRFLYGVLPDALLEAYDFWQDESVCSTEFMSLFQSSCGDDNGDAPVLPGYKYLRGYPQEDGDEYMILVEFQQVGSISETMSTTKNMMSSTTSNDVNIVNNSYVVQCTGLPGRVVTVTRRPKKLVEAEFKFRQRIASLCESYHMLQRSSRERKKVTTDSDKEQSQSELLAELLQFKVDSPVECDYEGKGEYWPCVVRRVNDNATYDLEYVNEYKWVGTQRQVDPELVQKRGEKDKRARGEGVWHWEGMSDDEEDDFRYDSEDEIEGDDEDEEAKKNKDRLTFQQFNALVDVVLASDRNLEACVDSLTRIGGSLIVPFTSVRELAAAVGKDIAESPSNLGTAAEPVDSEDHLLLNLLYAPRRSRLFSIMKTLSRIENVGHICAWTKKSHADVLTKVAKSRNEGSIPFACPHIDLIELPRLKLAFTARTDHEGISRLYSVDHVDLFISNERNTMTSEMLAGIPHSLLLSNVRGETKVLVPVIPAYRPRITTAPFSTFIVLNRKEIPLSERFFLYPVHVSLSFLLTKGINSAVYLMLLRFLHRDYASVFRLADSIATDTSFNTEGETIFKGFARTNDDWHPDAHACRLKISLVTIDSGTASPWDLTIECARHIVKLDSISSACRLAPEEELQLLESDQIVLSSDHPRYNVLLHDDYTMALCYNRKHLLRSLLNQHPEEPEEVQDVHVDVPESMIAIPCRIPPRTLLTNWPYYQDNTVFGENYAQMVEITSAKEGEHSWANEVKGGDSLDSPPGGWLVVACFHTLWSANCVQIMPGITELVPLYQDLATFLTVRADCQGIVSVSKELKVTTFPTFIFFRGGKEIDRLQGHERIVERVVRCMSQHVTEQDKVAHAKRRHRLRLEAALAAGVDLNTLDDEDEKGGELEWTWDPEQCGESMCIEDEGMRVVMRDIDEDDADIHWEFSQNNQSNWKEISSKTSSEIEKAYRKGKLYIDGYFDCKELNMWPSDVKISTYEITGFYASWNDGSRSAYVRRRGDRLQVPGEESYITKEQQERDERSAEWRKRYAAFKKKMKEEKYGSDIESMRGTIGILPNTGKHKWTLRWNHEPARNGVSDAFGVAGDAYEQFGPMKGPCLGSSEDTGSSIALHADGKLYHNGIVLCSVDGVRHVPVAEEKCAIKEVHDITDESNVELTPDELKAKKKAEKKKRKEMKKTEKAKKEAESKPPGPGEFPQCDWAPLFGRDSLVACEFDSDLDGGTLRFFVDEKPLDLGMELKELYKMLGTTEVFPCVSMCPYDQVEEIDNELPPIEENQDAKCEDKDSSDDDSCGSDDESDEDGNDEEEEPVAEQTPEEQEALQRQKEEEEMHKEPSVTLLPAGWEELLKQQEEAKELARQEAIAKEEQRQQEEEEAKIAAQKVVEETADSLDNVDDDNEQVQNQHASENSDAGQGVDDATDGIVENKEEEDIAPATNVVEIPIDRIRWMYENDDGWQLYNTFLSKELEEASRDGKTEYSITFHHDDDVNRTGETITHKCNFDTKVVVDSGGTNRRLRRHVVSEGIASMWELLTMKYEKPHGLSGQGFLKTLEKVWGGSESLDGKGNGLGFLFLYSLLSGEVKARAIGSSGGGWGNMGMGGGGMGGGYMMYGGKGGYSAYGGRTRSNTSDSHRFALLLTQLYKDRQTKSLPASVVNVLGRNRQVSLRMPRFKDTRKNTGVSFFKGWVDESEPRSPVAELFGKVVPLMKTMKRKSAFHFPPPPPHKEMTVRPKVNYVPQTFEGNKYDTEDVSGLNRPELSDYGCQERTIFPVTVSEVANLANSVHYRLGQDSLRPAPPLAVKDSEHFRSIIKHQPDRIFVVDFYASWCGPCKALAPVFRKLALRTPTAVFLKVDIDECDKLAAEFKIEKFPTVKFLRGGCKLSNQVAEIKGGGPQFLFEFVQILNAKATKEESALLQKFTFNAPGDNVDVVLQNIASSAEQVEELVTQPLHSVANFVTQNTRKKLGMLEVKSELPFDVSNHEASKTAVATSVLSRIKDDIAAYANYANNELISKVANLADTDIIAYFEGNPDAEEVLREAHEGVQELLEQLYDLRDSDSQMVEDTIPLLEKASNYVNIYDENNEGGHQPPQSKILYLLNRMAGRNSDVWIEFLFGTLISSQGEQDLRRLNPFLSPNAIKTMLNLVSISMLRSNRLGHTNRCIGLTIALDSLLSKVLSIDADERKLQGATLRPKLIQSSEELSKNITVYRHYVKRTDQVWAFDPRYLVFEFVWNLQLRKKQVEIVDNFRDNLKKGVSKVKQMIMGAGKTSVVAPLLALILADGKSLVLSVVPKALVEMSRTNMRETFAAIMVKRIYTLDFDRSTTVQPAMRRSLENAASNRGVVVATPTTVKSIMLSYVEVLLHLKEAHTDGIKSKLGDLKKQAEELAKILKLFNEGVMLLDEVDLILHPLKSELNFPIGDKFDLDGSEDGERWSLPIHLLDAIFYTSSGRVSTFEQRGIALDILKRFADVVQSGIKLRHLQRLPHITLLNNEFYHESMKPILAEWCFLWLQKQHLHGIDRNEAVQYMLEGAAARSDNSTKVSLIEAALTKAHIRTGEIAPLPLPTLAHQKSMTKEESSAMVEDMERLKHEAQEHYDADEDEQAIVTAQIEHLEEAKSLAENHRVLVNDVYNIDEEIENHSSNSGRIAAELHNQILALTAKIAEIECPRDDSLDNSVIVWMSMAFAKVGGGMGAASTVAPSESSVSSICNVLEDSGYTIRRCGDSEEAISRARDLQMQGHLRCVIVGGDEHGAGCGPTCVKNHGLEICLRCHTSGYSHFGAHSCPGGGRGTFPITNNGVEDMGPLKLIQTLVDEESPHARLHSALNSSRTAIYSAHTSTKEADRMAFWEIGTTVTDEAKQLIQWVESLPSWSGQTDDIDGIDESKEGDDEEEDTPVPVMVRQSSEESDKALLKQYRAELEELETKKSSMQETDEESRKELIRTVAEKNRALEESVKLRIELLTEKLNAFRALISSRDQNRESRFNNQKSKGFVGPHCGRDCALALAWLDVSGELAVQSGDVYMSALYKHYYSVRNELSFMKQMSLAAKVIAHVTSPMHKKLLNLCHNWLSTFLPHCLAKVNRVSFGLLTAEDCAAALAADPHVPRSRLKLAVPFVGKDVPSRSSEFAHPDVIIGLTVLAYRYSGIRYDDYLDIIDSITSHFSHEIGPARDRESCIRHESWVYAAGGAIRGLKGTKDGKVWTAKEGDSDVEVVQLKFLQKSNEEQMEKLYNLLSEEPLVIHHYLTKTIFPLHMRSQRMKISASGQAVGGDMLVGKRLGFSGTPSDLLPQELGKCDYETGDDGMMLTTVLDKDVASYEFVKDNWTVEFLLESFAKSTSPRYNALIDTGALITGYSNEEVARELLDKGLEWCDGVVFLDDDDKKQVLVRATGRIVSADQCGVPLERRFAFYDQIHTTGMDIKHVVNATAVITLGKDMVFRDYVQGAYRMRGIGAGQKIHVCIIPEVAELMKRELKDASAISSDLAEAISVNSDDHVLEDIVAWLTINSLRSEQVQWTMLCLQNIGNLYRKNAFRSLHRGTKYFAEGDVVIENKNLLQLDQSEIVTVADSKSCEPASENDPEQFIEQLNKTEALALFNESIDFSLEAGVPDPVPFEKKLRTMLDVHERFLQPPQHAIGHSIMRVVGQFAMLENSANRLDTEQEREQEQEQEKEVEARRDKQIEVEKFVDREYSRQEETQRPWPFSILSQPIPPYDPNNKDNEHPFYPLKDFKLRHQEPLDFPSGLYVSTNYFNPKWSGLRRVKNVVMIMEYAPETTSDSFHLRALDEGKVDLTEEQEAAFAKAYSLLGFEAYSNNKLEHISRRNDLKNALYAATDILHDEAQLDKIMEQFSSDKEYMTYHEFRRLLTCGFLQPEYEGRFWVALSLAEAETVRRILHIRQRLKNAKDGGKKYASSLVMQSGNIVTGIPQKLLDNHTTEVALHYSLSCGAEAPLVGDGGMIFDASRDWWRNGTLATSYEASKIHNCFRFFDGDMHFAPAALNLLIRNVTGSVSDRERFFHAVVGCRRRMERKWQDTPLSRFFMVPHQWLSLKQAAQACFVREALKSRQLTLWEGFTAFDHDNTGMLSPSEVYGALVWLKVPNLSVYDVVDFIEAADRNKDGIIDYKEYMDMLTDPAIDRHESEDIDNDSDSKAGTAAITKVEPYGAEILREEMIKRKQIEIQKQKEERLRRQAYKDALDVKVYEEELEASKRRKGGANPVVYKVVCRDGGFHAAEDENDDAAITVTDFKFSHNEQPLRLAPTGKCAFVPIFLGTAALRPIKPMTCPKKHKLRPCFYSWLNCYVCRKRGTHYLCENYCGWYVCSTCYQGDRRVQEMERRDPSKNPTFFRLSKNCCFTLQIPSEGLHSLSRPGGGGNFTVSMEVRFEKLPPKGHLQSLLRFSLPDMAQARRLHRAGLYLNGDGVVVSSALPKGGLTSVELEKLLKVKADNSEDKQEETVVDNSTDDVQGEGESCVQKVEGKITFTVEKVTAHSRSARAGVWHVISVTVKPSAGEVSTYVNGHLCHISNNLDPADLRLQYKLVVLGGGRQAQNRGGDIRRITIHSTEFNDLEMRSLYYELANENPAIGGRAVKIQAAFRGYYKRKVLTAEGITTKFTREKAEEFLEACEEQSYYDY